MSQHLTSSRTIEYTSADGTTLIGYFVCPVDIQQPVAGVVVCPEWWGVTDYPKQRADALAKQGYAAFAIDVYGDAKVTDEVPVANEWMTAALSDQDALFSRAKAGLDTLADQPEVDAKRLAVIGFCFGGKVGLDLARAGLNLKAAVSFHGALAVHSPAQSGQISAQVVIHHGEQDSMVTMDDVDAFKQEMDQAKANYKILLYPEAKHGFTNPLADARAQKYGVDLSYNALADEQSNQAMLDLLQQTLA